jgi:hypothetical protein
MSDLPADTDGDADSGAGAAWVLVLDTARLRYTHLVEQSHADWLQPWLPEAVCGTVMQMPRGGDTLSAALLRRVGVRWPALSAWRSRINRIALLPRQDALRVFGTLALFARPAALYRTVDRGRLQALREFVGAPTCQALLAAPRRVAMPASEGDHLLPPSALAEQGLALVTACDHAVDRNMAGLMHLYLPPGALAAMPMSEAARRRTASLCDAFFNNVNNLIPDLRWLFGLALED